MAFRVWGFRVQRLGFWGLVQDGEKGFRAQGFSKG